MFGRIPLPSEIQVCTGKKYFHEIKGGAALKSALDRKRMRILLRDSAIQPFMHELAHLYLDLRWKVLPYSVSEPFAEALAHTDACEPDHNQSLAAEDINRVWRDRGALDRCQLRSLLWAVLHTDTETRNALPLR